MTSGPRYLLSLLCVLAAVGVPLLIAGLGADDSHARPANGLTAQDLAAKTPGIAHQVEQLRDLSFDGEPDTHIVGVGKLRREYERAQGKHKGQLKTAEDAYKMLGIVGAQESLSDIGAGIAEQVAGFYDPKRKQLFLVRNPLSENSAAA